MDPITGIGLAASLATLGEIAAKSSKALYHFSKRIRDAPTALKELCEEVESLQKLLKEVSDLVRHELGDEDIGAGLRRLAQAKQEAMTNDLQDFGQWVLDLKKQFDQSSSSGRHIRARFVKVLSEREICRFRHAFAANTEVLNTLQNQVTNRQVFNLTKRNESSFGAINAHLGALQSCIDGVATAVHEENPALTRIEEHLLKLLKLNPQLQIQSPRPASSTRRRNPTIDEDDAMESRKQTIVWWKGSTFCLPIGTLVVEKSATLDRRNDESSNQNAQCTYRYSVGFLPATWFPDLPVLASGEVLLRDGEAPKPRGSISISPGNLNIIPSTFVEAFHSADPFSLSHSLTETNGEALYMYFETNVRRELLYEHCPLKIAWIMELNADWLHRRRGAYWHGGSSTIQDHSVTGMRFENESLRMWLVEMRICYKCQALEQCCAGCEREYFSSLQGQHIISYTSTSSYFTYCSMRGGMSSRPTLCIASNEEGYHFFSKSLLPYMDPSMFGELHTIDKWWLTALDHNDNRFGTAILAELNSFFDPLSAQRRQHRTTNRAVWPFFDSYQAVVEEVLLARPYLRQNFLVLICSLGSSALLKPFIEVGYDFGAPLLHSSICFRTYIFEAVSKRNYDTVEALMAAGYRLNDYELKLAWNRGFDIKLAKAFERVLDKHERLLMAHASRSDSSSDPFHREYDPYRVFLDDFYLQPREKASRPIVMKLYQKLIFMGFGCFTQPPYSRSTYLGPDILYAVFHNRSRRPYDSIGVAELVDLRASLDYVGPEDASKQMSALEWAIELGYIEAIKLLAEAKSNFEDFEASLLHALGRAEECLSRTHPRNWPAEGILVEDYQKQSLYFLKYLFYSEHRETHGVSLDTDRQSVKVLEDALHRIQTDRPGIPCKDHSTAAHPATRANQMTTWRYTKLYMTEKVIIVAYKTQFAMRRMVSSAVQATPTEYALAAFGLILVLLAFVFTKLLHLGIMIFRHRHTLWRSAPYLLILLTMFLWRRWKSGEN